MTSQSYYDGELRPVLEHLLAARLAERHGVHLYQEPDAARRLLCRTSRDADLWRWIDPTTRPETVPRGVTERRGIPRHTLARLIDRLEKLCMGPEEAASSCSAILDELERAVVGRRRTLELVLIGILAGGHVLLEDLPGLGKTLIARSFAGCSAWTSPASSSPRTCCPPTWSAPRCTTSGRPTWCSARGRCSPSCCWPTRSTGRRPRPRRRCWRRWARARSAWTGRPAGCRSRSSCWPPTTRSSTRAPTSCPRPSSTGS